MPVPGAGSTLVSKRVQLLHSGKTSERFAHLQSKCFSTGSSGLFVSPPARPHTSMSRVAAAAPQLAKAAILWTRWQDTHVKPLNIISSGR